MTTCRHERPKRKRLEVSSHWKVTIYYDETIESAEAYVEAHAD